MSQWSKTPRARRRSSQTRWWQAAKRGTSWNPRTSLRSSRRKSASRSGLVRKRFSSRSLLKDLMQCLPADWWLSAGEPQTFDLKFKRAEDYPIDLYYLMDLSYSMEDDLENVKNLGTSLMFEMSKITSDFRIGEHFLPGVRSPARLLCIAVGPFLKPSRDF